MEREHVNIGFEFTNTFGSYFNQSSDIQLFERTDEICEIGEKLNIFLRQIGYPRRNDYIFMEDLTEEELEAVADFLWGYRLKNEGVQ